MKQIILFIVTILISYIWFLLDAKMFYYGKNMFYHNLLPQKIYPELKYDWEGGFALYDQYGFSLVAQKFPIANHAKENVKYIVKYGYNEKSILVLVTTDENKTKYIKIESDKGALSGLKINIFNEKIDNKKRDGYKWINVQKGVSKSMQRIYILLQSILILIYLYWIFFLISKIFPRIKNRV